MVALYLYYSIFDRAPGTAEFLKLLHKRCYNLITGRRSINHSHGSEFDGKKAEYRVDQVSSHLFSLYNPNGI